MRVSPIEQNLLRIFAKRVNSQLKILWSRDKELIDVSTNQIINHINVTIKKITANYMKK